MKIKIILLTILSSAFLFSQEKKTEKVNEKGIDVKNDSISLKSFENTFDLKQFEKPNSDLFQPDLRNTKATIYNPNGATNTESFLISGAMKSVLNIFKKKK